MGVNVRELLGRVCSNERKLKEPESSSFAARKETCNCVSGLFSSRCEYVTMDKKVLREAGYEG